MLKLKLLLCPLALLALSSCKNGIVISSDYCIYSTPIYVGVADVLTDETARQILAHDQTWQSICEVKK